MEQKLHSWLRSLRRKKKLKEVMDWVLDLGIPYFTVYALSTENISERGMMS